MCNGSETLSYCWIMNNKRSLCFHTAKYTMNVTLFDFDLRAVCNMNGFSQLSSYQANIDISFHRFDTVRNC